MTTEILRYEADGLAMVSNLYLPDGQSGPRPGVLVFPEAFGLGDHARSRAERLAGLGYVALACDIYGDGRQLETVEEVMASAAKLREAPEHIQARAYGALSALTARPEVDSGRVASIGYCMGGSISLELARTGADLKGIVGFHSGLVSGSRHDGRSKARILVCVGADDPLVAPENRTIFEEEMRGVGVDWQMHLYGGVVHSFTNPDADALGNPATRYDAKADARSWATMLSFFEEIFA